MRHSRHRGCVILPAMRAPAAAFAFVASLATALLTPGAARANGNNSHLWITLEARDQLPAGELKDLLSRPEVQMALGNGAAFPDGGYAVMDDYGEMAHWEPFVVEYMTWIRATYDLPYADNPEAAAHVAFLMGIISHGMGDQVYDTLYFAVGRVRDAAGWSDELLSDFDTATDVAFVVDSGFAQDVEPWAPSYDLAEVYQDGLGYVVDPFTIDTAQRFLSGVRAFPQDTAQDSEAVAAYRAQYPWGTAHQLDETYAGSPPCEASVVSAYMLAVWDRLHDERSLENLVIATSPAPGGSTQSTDATQVESQIAIIFGHAIDDTSLNPNSVRVSDANGVSYAVDRTMWREQSNVMRLRPLADWPADETLTVTLAAGVRTIDGLVLDADWSFEVTTAAATSSTPPPGSIDPTPNTRAPETRPDPPDVPEQEGCNVAVRRGGGAGAAHVGLAALLLAWGTRRRTRG